MKNTVNGCTAGARQVQAGTCAALNERFVRFGGIVLAMRRLRPGSLHTRKRDKPAGAQAGCTLARVKWFAGCSEQILCEGRTICRQLAKWLPSESDCGRWTVAEQAGTGQQQRACSSCVGGPTIGLCDGRRAVFEAARKAVEEGRAETEGGAPPD
jgi:hypothetical protein